MMSTRIQGSNKRKSTSNHSELEESPRIEEGDYATSSEDEVEALYARSRVSQGKPATSASTILFQVMRENQKPLLLLLLLHLQEQQPLQLVWAQVQEQEPCNLHKFRLSDPLLLLRQTKNFPFKIMPHPCCPNAC